MRADPAAQLNRLISPRSIAIVGLSADPQKHGARVLGNLRTFGFTGPIWGVNPRAEKLHGLHTYPSLADVPGVPDAVVLAVPAGQVQPTLEIAGKIGAGGAVLFGGGFAESDADGSALQDRVRDCARACGVRLIGPNSAGLINPTDRVVLSFLTCLERPADQLRAGPVALITQSGGSASLIHNLAAERGSGLAVTISTGNEADLQAGEALEFLVTQPHVKVVAMLLETVRDGPRFVAGLRAALAAGKPVVVCKVGGSTAGARAMLTHTGALSPPKRRLDAVLSSYGATATATPQELFDVAELMARTRPAAGGSVGVVTHSGGAAVLLADELEAAGVELPQPSRALRDELGSFLQHGSPGNPTDLGGIITEPRRFVRVVRRFVDAPDYDIVVAVSTPHPAAHTADRVTSLLELAGQSPKPLLNLWLAGDIGAAGLAALRRADAAVTTDVHALARAVGGLALFARRRAERARAAAAPDPAVLEQLRAIDPDGTGGVPTEPEAKKLLRAWGVPVVRGDVADTKDAAAGLAQEVGFPVVVKAVSRALPHKSDAGVVHLNLVDPAAVRTACDAIDAALAAAEPPLVADGYLVEEFTPGTEIVAGFTIDAQFGPLVLVGTGGVFAEAFDDVALGVAPLSAERAAEMIGSLRGVRLLRGFRGRPITDEGALAELLVVLSEAAATYADRIGDVDVNPVIFAGGRWRAADALVHIRPGPSRAAPEQGAAAP